MMIMVMIMMIMIMMMTMAVADHHRQLPPGLSGQARQSYPAAVACVEALALFLKPSQSGQLSR